MKPRTLFEKIWDAHVVRPADADTPAVLYVDLHLIHEVTSPAGLHRAARARPQGAPARAHGGDHGPLDADHAARPRRHDRRSSTRGRRADRAAREELRRVRHRAARARHRRQGIVHVIGPELGLTQPGMTIVCGDSHTSTHGAFGALAFGIGTSEVDARAGHAVPAAAAAQDPGGDASTGRCGRA